MLRLAQIFGDNMVLQQKKPIPVWGTANRNENITIIIQGQTKYATAAADGRWMIFLEPLKTSFQETLIICSDSEKIIYQNVSVGEVWLAGGQSNMEFYMLFDKEYDKEYKNCNNQNIHFWDCPEISYEGQEKDFDYSQMGYWRSCLPEELKYYSAVAYYFAKILQSELNVPIGIIGCNWGGSTASCWMNEAYVSRHGQLWIDDYYNNVAQIADMGKYEKEFRKNPQNDRGRPFDDPFSMLMLPGLSRKKQLEFIQSTENEAGEDEKSIYAVGPFSMTRPCGLYHYMLEKVAPYGIAGVIWYQGESDNIHAEIYKELIADLIDCWRELWKEEIPFFTVQLAPYERWLWSESKNFQIIRKAQERVAHEKDKVYLISSSDAGMRFDVHPKRKRIIGERLAKSVLSECYGKYYLWQAPAISHYLFKDGIAELYFNNAGEGLYLKGSSLNALEIYAQLRGKLKRINHKNWNASVEGDKIKIHISVTADSYIISFAQTKYYRVNLYNSGNIPVLPFEINIAMERKNYACYLESEG